jgi:pimeloyl-ACP methyl ester carboxylesterase
LLDWFWNIWVRLVTMAEPRSVRPPRRHLRALEVAWLPAEAAGFWALRPLLRRLGAGDQHPVLLLPGFGTDDRSLAPLRWTLRGQGYRAHSWGLGRNIGPTAKIVDGMQQRLLDLHAEHGRTVTLIGQSLGGVYGRLLAREHPNAVRQVITLGSPYRMVEGDRSNAQRAWQMVQHLHDGDLPLTAMREEDRPPLLVPATSIYSRGDGIAAWQTCIDVVREHAENIEVRGSHIGMGLNPAVVLAVLDRLGQPEGDWRPFAAPPGMRAWYPRPANWHERRSAA